MTATDERAGFMRAICERPADDTPRLVFADWLDDHGEGERAEFIRVQCELARLGPPRKRLGTGMGGPAWLRPVGPGVYTWMGDDDVPVQVGERVDVVIHPVAFKGRKKGRRLAHGLVVTRVEDRGSDGVHFVARKDADSKPWGGTELQRRERALLERPANGTHGAANWVGWATPPLGLIPSYSGLLAGQPFAFSRGFVSRVTCPADVWLRHTDSLAWRPGWEMTCPECNGNGQVGTLGGTMGCVRCSKGPWDRGTGRVPRPFPATAQPIESVVLTTSGHQTLSVGGGTMTRPCGREWYERRWPGIAFDLSRAVFGGPAGERPWDGRGPRVDFCDGSFDLYGELDGLNFHRLAAR